MTVDLANAGYALMLRLIAYSYAVAASAPRKALSVDLALGIMRAVTTLAERAARLPAGPSNPKCNAGMSFSALQNRRPSRQGLRPDAFSPSGSPSWPMPENAQRRRRCAHRIGGARASRFGEACAARICAKPNPNPTQTQTQTQQQPPVTPAAVPAAMAHQSRPSSMALSMSKARSSIFFSRPRNASLHAFA